MKLNRRTALLGLLSSFALKSIGQTPDASTVTIDIPNYSTFAFKCGEERIIFTSAEVMNALRSVDVPVAEKECPSPYDSYPS
jgi:hypothetical protein